MRLAKAVALGAALLASVAGTSAGAEQPGRSIPARVLPLPTAASPELQHLIASPPAQPASAADIPGLARRYRVRITERTIAGVHCYSLTPEDLPPRNAHRLLIHLHGGGYVAFSGLPGIGEAILMAGIGHFKVVSVDYRLAPRFPYPAALDDATAVWRALASSTPAANLAVFGTSAGGGLVLSLVQRAVTGKLAMPASIAAGSPWADMSRTGDSLNTNEFVDDTLVSVDGLQSGAVPAYAHGLDVRDPRISPIYGDFHGFPPTFLVTGTRDLFLSNAVRTERRLRDAGVEVEFEIFEGLSHAQYLIDDRLPETQTIFQEMAAFFDRHLGR